jgi:hypothetical protein
VREASDHASAERLLTRELAQGGVQLPCGSVAVDRPQTLVGSGRASFEHGFMLDENIAKINERFLSAALP